MVSSATADDIPESTPVKKQALMSSLSPLPPVHALDAATTTSNDLVNELKVAGGVIIRNMFTQDELDQMEKDLRPHLDRDIPWKGDFFPPETRRAFGLVGNKNEESTSIPQLNNTVCFSIGPGAKDQPLHRDDAIHHNDRPAVAEHHLGRDTGIGFFVAGKKATRQNGATRFIPGSHLWDYTEGPPREDQAFYAEMKPGDAFMVLSGCFHGGSANKTADEERLLYSCFFTRGWMRQEENQYLSYDIEVVKKLSPDLQQRVGYGLSKPFLGWVELSTPMRILHPDMEKYGDLW
ncbi:MAG: hypothetical protein M1834_000171 [Cirrosporium novae-zelandiae]|nr:MAG: hypothetical protein M1834_000171 [Cirrosporium novae-zelandiae]